MNATAIAAIGADAPTELDLETIMRLLPHRYPFLMIDRVVELRVGESAVGLKQVTANEPHFQGHFPGRPVMPGVLLIEAMAQTAAALAAVTLGLGDRGMLFFFATIEQAKFRRPVVPGDSVRLPVRKLGSRLGIWKFEGEAQVDGQVAATATFSAKTLAP
jgi:3-hydroxyacyl-[acyl-carrier-protein] dehydratase